MTHKELEIIRRRWEEFSEVLNPGYRAFMRHAHSDMGALISEIDRLHSILDSRPAINAGLPESYIEWSQGIYVWQVLDVTGRNS